MSLGSHKTDSSSTLHISPRWHQFLCCLSHHLSPVPGRRRTCSSNLRQGPNHGWLHAEIPRSCPCGCLVSSWVHKTRKSETYHLGFGFIMKTSFPLLLENQSLVKRKKPPRFLERCVRLWFWMEKKQNKAKPWRSQQTSLPRNLCPFCFKPSSIKGDNAQSKYCVKELIKYCQFCRWGFTVDSTAVSRW